MTLELTPEGVFEEIETVLIKKKGKRLGYFLVNRGRDWGTVSGSYIENLNRKKVENLDVNVRHLNIIIVLSLLLSTSLFDLVSMLKY